MYSIFYGVGHSGRTIAGTALGCSGSIIAPTTMHFLWNGVGALVLGGVSLAEDYPHLLVTSFSGAPLLSGGACKIEGSLIVLLVNVSLIAVFAVLQRRRKVV